MPRRPKAPAQPAYGRFAKMLQAGIDSPDVEDFDIKTIIAKLKWSIREGESSGPPVAWDPQAIKIEARRRVGNKGRSSRGRQT